MIKFEMKQSEFTDMIKKMALPNLSKNSYIFPTIALTLRPKEIEWIGKFEHVIAWIRIRCTIQDVLEPVKVPIDVQKFLAWLNEFKSENIVSFTHDPDNCINVLTNENDDNVSSIKSIKMRVPEMSFPDTAILDKSALQNTLLENFPFRLDKEDPDMILFQNGLIKPNISCTCDVNIFQDLVKVTAHNERFEIRNSKNNKMLKK